MSKTVNATTTARKRCGYLIPIEGTELKGPVSRGYKYVRIRDWVFSKRRFSHSAYYFRKVRVLSCSYCGQEACYTAIFPHSGYETIERLCPKCEKVYGPIADPHSNSNTVPVCNLL